MSPLQPYQYIIMGAVGMMICVYLVAAIGAFLDAMFTCENCTCQKCMKRRYG